MTFPGQTTSYYEEAKEKVKAWWSKLRGSESAEMNTNLKMPNCQEAQKESINLFLEEHQSLLQTFKFSTDSEFLKTVNDIYYIFEQLRNKKKCEYKGTLTITDWSSQTIITTVRVL